MQITTDQHGFPAITCPKCAGRGTIARYNNNYNGVCFQCGGARVVYPTATIRRHAAGYTQRLKDACRVDSSATVAYDRRTGEVARSGGFTPGQVVRVEQYTRDDDGNRVPFGKWRTVAAYRRTALIIGEGRAGDRWESWTLEGWVTFTDGSRERVWSENWVAQPSPELITEGEKLAAKCRASYERTIARRAGRHVK